MTRTFLVTGATGLIGQGICRDLLLQGHRVHILSRRQQVDMGGLPVKSFRWTSAHSLPPREAFEGVDAIINLMGEPILGGVYTAKKQQAMEDSRALATRRLALALAEYGVALDTYVGASAIGIYPFGPQTSQEDSPLGDHPLAQLCRLWEEAHGSIAATNHSILRIGCVLSPQAKIIEAAFKGLLLKTQVQIGKGSNNLSWIHLEDLLHVVRQCINGHYKGIINCTAPKPVANSQLNQKLRSFFKGPCLRLKAPSWLLRRLAGPPSDILLKSQDIRPQYLLDQGFSYRFADIDEAVADCLNLSKNPRSGALEPCFKFEVHQYLDKSPDEVWPFFADPYNLEKITPPTLKFAITEISSQPLMAGSNIRYKLNLRGIPLRWKTLIESYTPCHEFVDTQVEGPYRIWHHTHRFQSCGRGTLMCDSVRYKTPFGSLGLLALPYVASDIKRIFNFRQKSINQYI